MTTQPDIYTVEARRWAGAGYRANGMNCTAELVESGGHDDEPFVASYAATLRELNWQPPVDPDLVEARKVVADINAATPAYVHFASEALAGKQDDHTEIKVALAAIKRGRELERGA